MTVRHHCPDCGQMPTRMVAAGIYVTSCLGHSIKPGPGTTAAIADREWDAAVDRHLIGGGPTVERVAKVARDERPDRRAPDVPQTAESVDVSALNAELATIHARIKEIENEASARLTGLRVRHDGRDCYVSGVTSGDQWLGMKIEVFLWAPTKRDPLVEYCGDEYRGYFDFSQLEVLPPEGASK